MVAPQDPSLRVLIANERRVRLEQIARVVAGLGHEVIAREIHVTEVAPTTAREHPDVALVGLGSNSEHALDLISEIVRAAACPVIAMLETEDPDYVRQAATRGRLAPEPRSGPSRLDSWSLLMDAWFVMVCSDRAAARRADR